LSGIIFYALGRPLFESWWKSAINHGNRTRLNLSPNYLSDLLQKFTGKTTLEHIHLEIIDRAKSLLWGTDASISEIAYQLGFEHPSHFTKVFKSKTGRSPSEYRHSK
jgi:AraC-like DNA-binding protein